MAFNSADFANDTDFERFALDLLGPHRVRADEAGGIYHDEADPVGGGRRRSTIHLSGRISMGGGTAREELRQSLRPLGFGAAYKILDLLIEHVLRAKGQRLNFKEKSSALAKRPASLPVPLDGRADVWDRIAAVYVALQDARHAVTHRRAQVASSGDLEIYANDRLLADTISGAELAAFAAAVHTLAEAVIDGDADPRRMNIVVWHMNTLRRRHRLPTLPAIDPDAGRRLLISDLTLIDGGLVQFDLARAHEIVAGQPTGLWDVELRAGGRVFVGRWEDVPNHETGIEFHPASPPDWLAEQAT